MANGLVKHRSIKEEGTLSYILDQEQLDGLEEALTTDLMTLGIQSVILIDMAGNVIVNLDEGGF